MARETWLLDELAVILKGERTWTNWPQMNDAAIRIADLFVLRGRDRETFLEEAGATDGGQPNTKPYQGNPDGEEA